MSNLTPSRAKLPEVLRRLNEASVKKHYDAYADIDWDAPEHRIDPEDPRWELPLHEPIGASEWYRSLPLSRRSRIGLDVIAMRLKMGAEFENVLSHGLLELARSAPNGSPMYRYAYHELIEEGQHSLMFQEFVNRSGADPKGLDPLRGWIARSIPRLARRRPELFFLFVLAGEVPIDTLQRRELRSSREMHPLLRRIVQIHVTEEARHVYFADRFLQEHVPATSPWVRGRLRIAAPFVTDQNVQLMLRAPRWLLRRHAAPPEVIREIQGGAAARRLTSETAQPLVDSLIELGLITGATAPVWRALGYAPVVPDRLGPGAPTRLAS